ncbi:ficolin-1-like [Armigeres subalbatus]|uniref:ficolin-1-like n=1 Tax=Armigeres subalbatus TaxID=124917 RepID=UPI002ED3E56F
MLPVAVEHPRRMEHIWLLLLVVAIIGLAKGLDVEGNSTVSSAGFGYELTVTGLDAVNYNMQKDHLRSKEYHQIIVAEIEDLRKLVANTEALVMKQNNILNNIEMQMKKVIRNAEIIEEIPIMKNQLEMLAYNITRILSDTSKINRAQQTLATTEMLNDFLLQQMGDSIRTKATKSSFTRMVTLEATQLPQSCLDVGSPRSGIHRIHPQPGFKESFEVYCDQTYLDGGWTVIQNRFDGSVNFYRGWNEYEHGFGNLRDGEFWLGLSKIHELTYSKKHELHIVMEDFDGKTVVAKYSNMQVGGPEEKYILNSLGTYSGDAGDSLSYAVTRKFTTLDSDNDAHSPDNCAVQYKSGWWMAACHESNLNGLYLKGKREEFATMMCWKAFRGYNYGLKRSRMMIRPVS